MTDIKKWYSDWYSGEEELTDEEEQSLAELDMMVDKAIADERAKVLSEVEDLLMDETLISYASWRRSTRKYGGTQEEYERLEDILNNQNQLRAELRTKLNQLKGGE